MKKVLITGASGFVGKELYRKMHGHYLLTGTYNSNPIEGLKQLDFSEKEDVVLRFLDEVEPDIIFHLAAEANINLCAENKSLSWQINVSSTRVLTEWCSKNNKELIFTSTDQVFDGKTGMHSESDLVAPLHDYGAQKVASETLVLAYNKGKVCRMPLMIGSEGGYMKAFIQNLKEGNAQQLFTDEYRSVLHVKDAATALIKALDWEPGLYHIGGPERMDRFELGTQIAEAYNLDLKLLSKSSHSKVRFRIPRPADVSFNSQKAQLLGFEPKLLRDRLLERNESK